MRDDRCIRCGNCFEMCKNNAVKRVDGGFTTLREACIECGECVEVCHAESRELAGKEMTEGQVMAEIDKDVIFYEQSGGGASFSGGEPLLQHEFLLAMLQSCKAKNIHTVVDTSGMTSAGILERISEHVDLFLFDLKTLDEKKHREFTGVSNVAILANLRRLAEWKKNVIVRIPIIPRVNDDLADIREAGELIASLGNVKEVHLLPYHTIGVEKYRRLGKEYEMPQTVPPSADEMSEMVKALRNYVSSVSIGG